MPSMRTAVSACSRASSTSCLSAASASCRRNARTAITTREASNASPASRITTAAARGARFSIMSVPYIDSPEQNKKRTINQFPGTVPVARSGSHRIDRFRSTAYIAAMALRDILILPDKRLRQACEPVKKIDAGIRKLIEDMFETMYDAPGIGLAAIQVGTPKRIITMDLAKKEE